MLVVPGLAMFSHKVPAGTRRQLRESLWQPLGAALAEAVGLGGGAAAPAPRPPSLGAAAIPAAAVPATSAAAPAAAAIEPIFAAAAPASVPPSAPPPPPPPPAGGDAPTARADGPRADRATLEATLRACGASGVEWEPGAEGDGLLRCLCRMPAEPTGQLERVFQASGPDAITALEALVGQVTAWSARQGTAAASGPAARRNR